MNPLQLKRAIAAREPIFGVQQFLPSPSVTEIIGLAGFDFVMICTEHGTVGYGPELENCVRAATLAGAMPFVRVAANESHLIRAALECGAKGVIVPLVKTRADVARAVASAKFPPMGNRGICAMSRAFGYKPQNPETFVVDENSATFVVPLIEHIEAVENIEAILEVEGVDFVLFGTGDLSASLGLREKLLAGDPDARAAMDDCRSRVLEACAQRGIPVAQIAYRHTEVRRLHADGIHIFLTVPESFLLRTLLEELLCNCRTHLTSTEIPRRLSYGTVKAEGNPL
jgi:4-hydroxy-2-oxoheptanedioate aldolase